jgi:hypothetical protein
MILITVLITVITVYVFMGSILPMTGLGLLNEKNETRPPDHQPVDRPGKDPADIQLRRPILVCPYGISDGLRQQ